MEEPVTTYYDSKGQVFVECGEMTLVLKREEAEDLFVSLGHTLQDMDQTMENLAE